MTTGYSSGVSYITKCSSRYLYINVYNKLMMVSLD